MSRTSRAKTTDDCAIGGSLLAGYSSAVLRAAGLIAHRLPFRRGERMFFCGQARESVWLIESGWVRILLPSPEGESTAEILGPGDLCGCPACAGKSYTCTAVALTDVRAAAYSARRLESFLHDEPEAVCRLSRILGRRLQEIAELKFLSQERAERRIPRALRWFRRKFGDDLPIDQRLIAEICNLSRETCSRQLARLRRRGILESLPGRLRILRPAALEGDR